MKRLITCVVLVFYSLIVIAPNLSECDRAALNARFIENYKQIKYEIEFNRFINHLGLKESNNDWTIINSINCMGEWQFSYRTLKHLGYAYFTPKQFKTDPSIFPRAIQLDALHALIKTNLYELRYHLDYIGMEIKGTTITKAGLIAASHLGGAGSVRLYLESFGSIDKRDIYGTKISDYIKEFSLYNL